MVHTHIVLQLVMVDHVYLTSCVCWFDSSALSLLSEPSEIYNHKQLNLIMNIFL